MKAIVKQNFVVYNESFSGGRLLITEGDEAEVVWKEDSQSKIRFLNGDAKGTDQVLNNMFLDFIEE